jgi:hypothetical protein
LTDRHVRILAEVARHHQRRLDEHDGDEDTPSAVSVERRDDLETTATRTRARVAAARARRNHPARP